MSRGLEDVGLRLLSKVVPVENKHKFIYKFTCHTTIMLVSL